MAVTTIATIITISINGLQLTSGGLSIYGKLGVVDPIISSGLYGLKVLASFFDISTFGTFSVVPATSSLSVVTPFAAASTYHRLLLPYTRWAMPLSVSPDCTSAADIAAPWSYAVRPEIASRTPVSSLEATF